MKTFTAQLNASLNRATNAIHPGGQVATNSSEWNGCEPRSCIISSISGGQIDWDVTENLRITINCLGSGVIVFDPRYDTSKMSDEQRFERRMNDRLVSLTANPSDHTTDNPLLVVAEIDFNALGMTNVTQSAD